MPSPFWSGICVFGFLGWVLGTFGFIFRAFNEQDRFLKKRALYWGILVTIFYTLWILGLLKA